MSSVNLPSRFNARMADSAFSKVACLIFPHIGQVLSGTDGHPEIGQELVKHDVHEGVVQRVAAPVPAVVSLWADSVVPCEPDLLAGDDDFLRLAHNTAPITTSGSASLAPTLTDAPPKRMLIRG